MSAADANRIAASAKEFGEFLAEAAAGTGKPIKDADMLRIKKEFLESVTAMAELYAHLKATHAAGKPDAERRPGVDLPVRHMSETSL